MDGSKIAHCTCEHKVQDEIYGKQNRVHNWTKKGWRCIGCLSIKPENVQTTGHPVPIEYRKK